MNLGTQKLGNAGTARRAFTIVELLMVIGIISVLIGITVSAVSGSLKRARRQRANALCTLVSQGIATYYAQKGEWPEEPKDANKQDEKDANGDTQVSDGNEYYLFQDDEADRMIRKVVEQTKSGNPMIDVSGLFVAREGQTTYGRDFFSAIHGTRENSRKLKLNEMVFGYPDPDTGRFRRFKIRYYPATDRVSVSL